MEYVLTFSTRRLISLLEDAGISAVAPSEMANTLIRFVSDPSKQEVHLEVAKDLKDEWTPPEPRTRDVQVRGQYL